MSDPSAATTWWFTLAKGDQEGFLILVAPTREAALEDAAAHALVYGPDVVMGTPEAGDERTPCSSCPHMEPCYTSMWESPQRFGDNRKFSWEEHTTAHTCPICFNAVLDVPGETERRVVPEGCPRWGPLFASAIECGECREYKEMMDRSHPDYEARMAVAAKFGALLLREVKKPKLPEGVEDLDRRRGIHDLAGEFADTHNAFTSIQKALEEPGGQEAMSQALLLVTSFWKLMGGRQEVQVELARARDSGFGEVDEASMQAEWLEGMFLAIRRNGLDLDKLIYEWKIVVTKRGLMARAWTRIPLPSRKMLERSWFKVGREVLP